MCQPWRLLALAIFVAFPCIGRAALVDDFDNGIVEDTDSAVGFWGTNSFGGSANQISESNSHLSFTVGDDNGTNQNDFGGASIFSNGFHSEFGFFSKPVTISVRGIQFQSTGDPFVGVGQRHLRVGFVSSGVNAFQADDAVFARIFETGVSVRSKINETNTNGQGTEQANIGNLNGVGGIDFTIGPGAAGMLDYSLITYFPSGASAGSTTGSFAYDALQWNQTNQSARLLVMAQELNVPGGNQTFHVTLDSIDVVAVPEPSMFLFTFVLVICSVGRFQRRIPCRFAA